MSTRGDLYYGSSQNDSREYIVNRYYITHNAFPEAVADFIEKAKGYKPSEEFMSFDAPLINKMIAIQPNMFILNNTNKESGYRYEINQDKLTIKCEYKFLDKYEKIFEGSIDDFIITVKQKAKQESKNIVLEDAVKYKTKDEVLDLIKEGGDINFKEGILLEHTIEYLKPKVANLLIEKGININNKAIGADVNLFLSDLQQAADSNDITRIQYYKKDFKSPLQQKIIKLRNIIDREKMKNLFREKINLTYGDLPPNFIDSLDALNGRFNGIGDMVDFRFSKEEKDRLVEVSEKCKGEIIAIKESLLAKHKNDLINTDDVSFYLNKINVFYDCKDELENGYYLDKAGFAIDSISSEQSVADFANSGQSADLKAK